MQSKENNILVTGACGFVGSHLVEALLKSGYRVIAFDFKNVFDKSEIFNTLPVSLTNRLKKINGNTEDVGSLYKISENISHIFHLAARTFIPESWINPLDFYRTNILGTANILEISRRNNCHLTYISSYVYGEPEYLPIDESHPLKSYNPYSQTKLIVEEICDFYKTNYNLKITIFRPFNLYGPGQNYNFIIPEIINQLISDEIKIIEVNDLKPKRDYLYIDDFIKVLILSINNRDDIYNIGSGFSISVEDIINIAIKVSGIKKQYISRNINRKNEVFDVIADNSKAVKNLKWQVNTSLEEGIKNCIEYQMDRKNSSRLIS